MLHYRVRTEEAYVVMPDRPTEPFDPAPEPEYLVMFGGLLRFFLSSSTTLVGTIDPSKGGAVVTANPASRGGCRARVPPS